MGGSGIDRLRSLGARSCLRSRGHLRTLPYSWGTRGRPACSHRRRPAPLGRELVRRPPGNSERSGPARAGARREPHHPARVAPSCCSRWLGAAVLVGVFWYWGWWLNNPHTLFGIHPQFGVQRWISVALMAGVGYFGMILFPRLTASMAGAVAGPTLFAVAGYTLFPSLMERAWPSLAFECNEDRGPAVRAR